MRRLTALALATIVTSLVTAGCDDATSQVDPVDGQVPLDAQPVPDEGVTDAMPTADADRAGPDGGVQIDPDAEVEPDAGPPADAETDAAADMDPRSIPLTEPNMWGPTARVTRMQVPVNPTDARRSGCMVVGSAAGSRIYSLLLLAGGGLDTQVRPNGAGRINLVVLVRALGWMTGVPAGDLETLDIEVLPGAQGPDLELLYRTEAFVDGDPAAGAVTTFTETFVDDGWLDSDTATLTIPISILNSPELPLTLDLARLSGRIRAAGPSFAVDGGVIGGYLTVDRVLELVRQLRDICTGEERTPFCALIDGQLDTPDDELLELMIGFIGGLEVRVADGRAVQCDPEVEQDCNALGVCLLVEGEPVEVEGIAPPAP